MQFNFVYLFAMPYICVQLHKFYMLGKDILCSECAKNGYKPTKLGVVEKAEGTIRLWCKRCKAEILVTITKDKIITEKI